MKITASQENLIDQVARSLKIQDPIWLKKLINFESKNDPNAKNPWSSARGLIQFIDSTAKGLGYENSLDLVTKHPTFESQLQGPVYRYLKMYMPFLSEHSLYMSVFYPVYRFQSPDTPFPAHVQKVNPGITTPADYVNFINKTVGSPLHNVPKAAPLLGVGFAALVIWYFISKQA